MSTVLGQMKFRVDENTTEMQNVKKIAGEANKAEKVLRRAALGDIKNRQPRAVIGAKDTLVKDEKDNKLSNARPVVKARVDTHWKKGALSATTDNPAGTTSNASSAIVAKPLRAAAIVQGQKVLTRSNSLRSISTKTTTVTNATTTRAVGGAKIEQQTKTKTKLVENKVQQVKIEKVLPVDSKLRREDSNISRKSLTKLKAVLNKATTTVSSKVSSAVVAPKAVKTNEIQKQQEKSDNLNLKPKITNVVVQSTKTNLRIVDVKSHSTALIEGVRNIDEGDDESLILVSEYVNDIYEYLFQLESEQQIDVQHLSNQIAVTPKMRAVLLDWINEVHSQFHLVTETFHITVGIIDRYLQAVPDTLRTNLQLVGVTALFIAAKYEELYPPAICDFIFMTDHSYNQQQLLDMEIQIFRTLDCNLSRPVSIHFLRRFSKAADVDDEQHAMSKYFLELAAIEYDLAHYRPSEIAAASLLLTLHLFKCNSQKATGFNDALWNATLEHYSHYNIKHLRPITRKIAAIARNAPEAKLTAVYTKYSSQKFYKTALRQVLHSPLMNSIIKD